MTAQAMFRLDLNLCTGCSACSIACGVENDVGEGVSWRRVYTFNEARLPGAAVFHYSLACNHCREPACLYACPAAAYTKVEPSGVVSLDPERCIGCRYCSWVCPYDAPQYNPSTGLMEKCTFCSHRLDRGVDPACVTACPVAALGFVPHGEPGPLDQPGLPELGLEPGLSVEPKRESAAAPEMTAVATAPASPAKVAHNGGLRAEWPLFVFSYVLPWLVAWFAAAGAEGVSFHAPGFLVAGAAAMAISTVHLGRPARAWRAVMNLRWSWVSREIFFSSAFLLSAAAVAWRGVPGLVRAWPVTALGFAALVSMDLVYRIPKRPSESFPHSAMCSLTAAMATGLLLRDAWIFAPAAAMKLAMYLARASKGGAGPPAIAAVRVFAGFVCPLAVWTLSSDPAPGWLLAGPLVGEAVDRAQFYAALRFPSPAGQIDHDLRRLLAGAAG